MTLSVVNQPDHIEKENAGILPGPLSNLREINFGIVLLAIYFLFDFGAVQGVFEFVNAYRLPFIVAALSVFYAIYLVLAGRVDLRSNTTRTFITLTLFIIVDSLLRTKNPRSAHANVTLFLQYLANYLIMVACVKKPSQFILLIDIWLVGIMHSCYHAIYQGGKLWDSIWLKDENHISIIAAYAIPFALVLFTNYRSRFKKSCYAIAMAFYVTAVVVAASRGGALAMICIGLLCWLLYKHKIRNFLVIMIVVGLILGFAPKKFFSEMETLKQSTHEGTARDRIYLWKIALKMFYDHPIVGVGPMNNPEYFPHYDRGSWYGALVKRPPHTTPLQWLSEEGIIGSIIFMLLQISLYRNWRLASNYKKKSSFVEKDKDFYVFEAIGHSCAIAQVGFWCAAVFLSLLPYPFYWCLVPFSEAWKNLFLHHISIERNAQYALK